MSIVGGFVIQTVKAIDVLHRSDCFPQALIVLYAGIDSLAWLSADEEIVTGKSFIAWTERYMLPGRFLRGIGTDLYAARCALLHTRTAQSRLSRSGSARQIWDHGGGDSRQYVEAQLPVRIPRNFRFCQGPKISRGIVEVVSQFRLRTHNQVRPWVLTHPRRCRLATRHARVQTTAAVGSVPAVFTDAEGRFVIPSLAPGRYQLSATKPDRDDTATTTTARSRTARDTARNRH
jgi:hypothetical protein